MVLTMLSSLGSLEGCKSSSSFCTCWIPWFVTWFAEVSRTFAEYSSPVRNYSSKPSSSTNTIGGTPDVFVAFASSSSLAVVVPDAGSLHCTSHQLYGICLPSFNQHWIWLVAPELCICLLFSSSGASCLSC